MVDTTDILATLRHYFKLSLKAVEDAHRILAMEANETISGCNAQN